MNTLNWQELKTGIWKYKPRVTLTLTRTRLAILILGLVALWGMAWLGITTQIALVGQQVRELDDQLDLTRRQNAQLEYDIAVITQPDRIARRAAALGLRPATPSQTIYLDIKYPARLAVLVEKKSEPSPSFDLGAWLNNAFAWMGAPARSAEASQ